VSKSDDKQETEKKKADVCQEFGLVNSTIEKIYKNRTQTLVRFN